LFDDAAAWSLHLMEIELKTAKSSGDDIYQAVDELLRKGGVKLCDRQEPKTLRLFWAMGYPVKDGKY